MTPVLMQGDCLSRMDDIPDKSVDMILVDLPYGTTSCNWDIVIPFDLMWAQLNRVIKPNAPVVMTSAQPFTSTLIASNIEMFKYCWYWKKSPIGFLNSKKRPLVVMEDIVVFNANTYNPQGLIPCDVVQKRSNQKMSVGHSGGRLNKKSYVKEYTNYPTQLLDFKGESGLHPTQKPVDLMKYLIKTYTNEGETVLDFTMGSGTTGVACIDTNRNFIGIEKNSEYFKIAEDRIKHQIKNKELFFSLFEGNK